MTEVLEKGLKLMTSNFKWRCPKNINQTIPIYSEINGKRTSIKYSVNDKFSRYKSQKQAMHVEGGKLSSA